MKELEPNAPSREAREDVATRVAKVQAMIKAELGELPKGRVDAFLAERRAAAERGE
jgi:hypothetical protein